MILIENSIKDIEKQILEAFYKIIFLETVQELEKANQQISLLNAIENAASDESIIRNALRSGKIQYSDGLFSGRFSASISRALRNIGARFHKRMQSFYMDIGEVPVWIKSESAIYTQVAKEVHDVVLGNLDLAQTNVHVVVDEGVNINALSTLKKENELFLQFGNKFVPDELLEKTMPPNWIEDKAEEFAVSIREPIRNFSISQIEDLRDIIKDNADKGYRFEKLIDSVKQRFEVTKNKAKFLARQETSLYVSRMKEERYKDSGVTNYRWSTSRDERVRDDHKKLHGREFSFDNPPIVDSSTGRRANPGEDFQCRCVAIPII